MSASSALIVTLFLGGYHLPYLNTHTLHSHMPLFLIAIMALFPLLSLFFARWIKRNNRFTHAFDIRNKESAALIKLLVVLNVIVVFGIGMFLYMGLDQTSIHIATAMVQIATFAFKLLFMNFVFVWVRWTLPRFRYDQLQDLGWKVLMPLAIANIFITAIVVVVFGV